LFPEKYIVAQKLINSFAGKNFVVCFEAQNFYPAKLTLFMVYG